MAEETPKDPAAAELPLAGALSQLYRGEIGRSDRWRTRLDTTTNWALITASAAIAFAFSTTRATPLVLLIGILMVTTFLLIEARRYRYYDLWIRRVRLLEEGYWAPLLRHEPVDPDALRELALEMERPQIQLSLFSAIATRLNRAYGAILLVLTVSWFMKVQMHPEPARSLHEFLERAHVGPLPGAGVVILLALFIGVAALLFVSSFLARAPLGEVRVRRRTRRLQLWEVFARPYAVRSPRRSRTPARRPGSSGEPVTH